MAMPSSGNYMLIYDQCHSVLVDLNTIQHWKRNHGLNVASPPQRLPLGIQ